jgi:DNA polymerase-1
MEFTAEERATLKGIYNQVKDDLTKAHTEARWQRTTNSDVLIVDGMNNFMRAWSAIPSMNDNGDHTGGIVGFFRSVGYAIKLLHPTRCVVAFDGIGGSFKRRKIYPEYKERRKNKIRLNRIYEDQTTWSEEEKNCLMQLARLDHYLQLLPVNILRLDHVEADDTIAYCAMDTFKNSNVTIMSTDKDFLQLVMDRIKVWSPTKKIIYGPAEVMRDFGFHPNNFVLFRAMDGDASDSIDGIKGAGPKTILKCFPFLAEEKIHTLDDIINHAMVDPKKYKIYEKVIEGKAILERNIALMQLKDSLLTTTAQLMVNELLETPQIPHMNRNAFVRLIVEDGMVNNFPDHQNFLTECFGGMDSVVRDDK